MVKIHVMTLTGSRPGFKDKGLYKFWSWRMCGLACLRSILLYRDGVAPSMASLLDEALTRNVYVKQDNGSVLGLIYSPFCKWINKKFSFNSSVHERIKLSEILKRRDTNDFIIASVSKEIRCINLSSSKRGGHLVLITNHNNRGQITFYNPSGFIHNHADVTISNADFERYYANRGILIPADF